MKTCAHIASLLSSQDIQPTERLQRPIDHLPDGGRVSKVGREVLEAPLACVERLGHDPGAPASAPQGCSASCGTQAWASTRAPSASRRSQTAKPIPARRLTPVTTHTRSSNKWASIPASLPRVTDARVKGRLRRGHGGVCSAAGVARALGTSRFRDPTHPVAEPVVAEREIRPDGNASADEIVEYRRTDSEQLLDRPGTEGG